MVEFRLLDDLTKIFKCGIIATKDGIGGDFICSNRFIGGGGDELWLDGKKSRLVRMMVRGILGGATGVSKIFFILFALFDSGADFSFDIGASARILIAGTCDDGLKIIVWSLRDIESGSGEGWHFFAINNHGNYKVAIIHLDEVGAVESGLELFN